MLSWPHFSVTSYGLVRTLVEAGVRPLTVIDAGANVGQFAIAIASFLGNADVFCFEPDPEALLKLKRNTQRMERIRVFDLALGESNGTAELHANRDSRVSSLLPLSSAHLAAFPHAQERAVMKVRQVTLDDWAANRQFQLPVMLKLDVQGSEASVLRGAEKFLSHISLCLVECSFKRMYEGETLFDGVAGALREKGFRFERPIDFLQDPRTGEILQMDALFAK